MPVLLGTVMLFGAALRIFSFLPICARFAHKLHTAVTSTGCIYLPGVPLCGWGNQANLLIAQKRV